MAYPVSPPGGDSQTDWGRVDPAWLLSFRKQSNEQLEAVSTFAQRSSMSALIDWDRLPTETPKSYAAFLAYVALGARRSVREAARQHHVKTASSGPEVRTVKHCHHAGAWVSDGE